MISRFLSSLVLAGMMAFADSQPAPKLTKGISISVIQGDAITYNLPNPQPAAIAIRVADSAGKPIQNAVAVFEVPELGPSALMADGSHVKVVITNVDGYAAVELRSNGVPGHFEPKVTVNYLGQTATLNLKQENAFAANIRPEVYRKAFESKIDSLPRLPRTNNRIGRRFSKKVLMIVAGLATGGVAAFVAMRGGGGTTPTPAGGGGITVTPGSGTVGGN